MKTLWKDNFFKNRKDAYLFILSSHMLYYETKSKVIHSTADGIVKLSQNNHPVWNFPVKRWRGWWSQEPLSAHHRELKSRVLFQPPNECTPSISATFILVYHPCSFYEENIILTFSKGYSLKIVNFLNIIYYVTNNINGNLYFVKLKLLILINHEIHNQTNSVSEE